MADTIWMTHPRTGEKREVIAEHENYHPLMLAGWKQCEAPAALQTSATPGDDSQNVQEQES